MKRHLERTHSEEPLVAGILAMRNSDHKKKAFDKLRLTGDFNHNMEVLEKQDGELLVMRRPSKENKYQEYLPCIYCYGFIHENDMYRHFRVCKHKDSQQKLNEEDKQPVFKSLRGQCQMLLEGAAVYDHDPKIRKVRKVVVHPMTEKNNERVKQTVENDEMILQFGSVLLHRKGKARRHDIATKMRQLSRLVLTAREMEENDALTLHDLVDGQYFDTVVNATLQLSEVDESHQTQNGVAMTRNPSVGLHLGHSLAKVCQIKRGKAVRLGDEKMKDEAKAFYTLLRDEWTDSVSSPALQTLQERRLTKRDKDQIPETSDLKLLDTYANVAMTKEAAQIKDCPCPKTWRALCATMFVIITIFNKRRGGEVAKLRTSSFEEREGDGSHNAELLQSLSALEKQLVKR